MDNNTQTGIGHDNGGGSASPEKVLISCRAKVRPHHHHHQGCDGDHALMHTEQGGQTVRYECLTCGGSWVVAKGGSFSM